jgi:hypothetical protein
MRISVYCKVNKDVLTYVEDEQFCCMRLRKHYMSVFESQRYVSA